MEGSKQIASVSYCKRSWSLVEGRLADITDLTPTDCVVLTPASGTHSKTWFSVRWGLPRSNLQ